MEDLLLNIRCCPSFGIPASSSASRVPFSPRLVELVRDLDLSLEMLGKPLRPCSLANSLHTHWALQQLPLFNAGKSAWTLALCGLLNALPGDVLGLEEHQSPCADMVEQRHRCTNLLRENVVVPRLDSRDRFHGGGRIYRMVVSTGPQR